MLCINKEKSLQKYRHRLLTEFCKDDFAVFSGKFIGTYDVWGTFFVENTVDTTMPKCGAFTLLDVVVNHHGINCLGVTSMRKKGGKWLSSLPGEMVHETHVVYCQKHNYFTQMQSSPFRMIAKDYVKESA